MTVSSRLTRLLTVTGHGLSVRPHQVGRGLRSRVQRLRPEQF